jgi:general secretion pathway protein H
MPVTSTADSRRHGDRGFALYELILALAILGMVAVVVVPRLARAPGPVEIRMAADEIAAVFRSDRNLALRTGHPVISKVDVERGTVLGGSGEIVQIPRGITFTFIRSSREGDEDGGGIRFLPDGGSSGGVLTLSRATFSYRITVNWLTAGVRISRIEAEG